jgi:hypothetical protein
MSRTQMSRILMNRTLKRMMIRRTEKKSKAIDQPSRKR